MKPLLKLCQITSGTISTPNTTFINPPFFLFVGGVVRDYILQISKAESSLQKLSPCMYILEMESFQTFLQTKYDIDISTVLSPKDAARVLDETFCNTKRVRKFATNIIQYNSFNIDCTSTRIDTECDGRHAKMEFGISYFQDSLRRDFTFNAMYLSSEGMLFDFHGGINHLMSGEIHFIGDARTRILEDYTRIKRYRDFSHRFNMKNMEIESIIEDIIATATQPIIMR